MSRIVWACWDGGGNLTPSLGIATALERRGHEVRFYGRPEMVGRAGADGVTAAAFEHARTDLDRYSFHPLATVFGYTSSPAVGEELVEIVAVSAPDLVVIDAMFATALNVAPRLGRPTAVMLHTFCYRLIDEWRANAGMQSESRQRAGFDALPPLDELWGERDLLQVNTLRAFDGEPSVDWPHLVHGAPVLASERRAVPAILPWADGDPARWCCSASARSRSSGTRPCCSGRSTPWPRCPCTWSPPRAGLSGPPSCPRPVTPG